MDPHHRPLRECWRGAGISSDRPVWGLATGGVVLGLATATYLTRHWHNDEVTSLHAGLAPVDGGGMLTASSRW